MKSVQKLAFFGSMIAALQIPALAGVTVNSPANNAEIGSPFSLSANAVTCSSQTVGAMGYSLDNSTDTTIIKGDSVAASVASPTGAHTLHVKAWGEQGSVCLTDISVTVAAPNAAVATVALDAVSVSSIQSLGNWKAINDSVVGGTATGAMSVVNTPAMSGFTRKFVTSYSNYGGERYSVSFGDDTTATHFLYDAWVYLQGPSTSIANVEMDMNQVMPNGETVIYGVQCDGWYGTWDYTANKGTPQKPVDTWLHSKVPCNPRAWSTNSWHHVQISYSRNDSGTVTYQSVWLDGVQGSINATVPSAFALGWSPTLLTNFQVDSYTTASATSAVYLDNLTISRW